MNKNKKVRDINEYKKQRKHRNKKVEKKGTRKLKNILIAFLVLFICIINLCGNAIVSNLKYDINKKKQELRKEEIALDELQMERMKNGSLTNVEQEAKEKLGMDYPKSYQIRYIDMTN